ncbi:major facilitator superfamily transporter [Teratosphaeria nubilosa]|uniref:Major facilitator superfamily transporter n=1 Tax=Teratosphaeria nubilosa TaxID=161662 RepID=A0A6G1LD29_9PEZI|nr:major facilitator superfamily transporter [Teratosphaeria nubilosa]
MLTRSESGSTASRADSRGKNSTKLEQLETTFTSYEQQAIDGKLYRDGVLVLLPAPSQDPRDPLNLPTSRKFTAIFCLCFFGALAAAAELILGAMLPVFALVYAGLNPKPILKALTQAGGLPEGSDPLKYLGSFPNAPPIWKVYLLASLPVLVMGVCNLIFVPLAISCGRRPVLLGCGIIAIIGAIWAGCSQSLGSHLGARCLQALGAGTVESLIPFIIQDLVFVHQRNTWISALFAAQGILIISLGIATPYIILYMSWRWVYFMTAAGAGAFLIGVFFYLPETRWPRTRAEMNGVPRDEVGCLHEKRTFKYDTALFHGTMDWKKGWDSFLDTMRTFFYPQIFFITMLNSVMIGATFAAGYTVAPALLTKPWSWPFLKIGLCLIPVLIAAIATGAVTGFVADWSANMVARKRGKREPENQLINLILPTACGIVGSILFGVAGSHQSDYSWGTFLFALGLMGFGFLGANTVGAVYVLECYPHLAGPALVNIASFRCLIAFVLSFRISEWVAQLGYLKSMMIYTGLMSAFALLLPVVYVFGPSWRRRWPADRYGDAR